MAQKSNPTSSQLKFGKHDKLAQKIIKASDEFLIQSLPYQRNIKNLYHELKNTNHINELLNKLFQIKFFNNFQLIQICYHQKSYSQAQIVSVDELGSINNGELSASEFHQYLQSVKKSKNKFFQTGVDAFPHFHSIGTFLAKEFIFPEISFLFIVSRNDFLRPTQEEYETFYYLSDLLNLKIRNLLTSQDDEHRREVIQQIYQAVEQTLDGKNEESMPLVNFYQNERLKLMADLLDTLKHELSNPLFGIKLAVENLIEFDDDQSKEIQTEIINNISRSQKIIDNFVSLYDSSNSNDAFDLVDGIQEALTLSKSATAGIQKFFDKEKYQNISLNINKTFFIQIVFNALVNSAQALKGVEDKDKTISITINNDQKNLVINISDNGPGFIGQETEKYFEPFFTTKEKGTGLGLSICKSLAKKINAEIELSNNEGTKGASFSITFNDL